MNAVETDGVVMIDSHEGSQDNVGEIATEIDSLERERRRGDAKGRKADMTGEMAAAESDDFGDWLAMDYEHSKAQIAAGGCGIAGGDCPDGFEHEPFRCGAEVICGDCGVVMPRGSRSYCARDAPRFWSKLGSRCDNVSPRILRQRQAAWQVYAELQSRGTAQGQQALPLDQEPVRRRRSEEGGRKGCSGGASAGAGAGEQASSSRSPSGGGIGHRMESCQGTVPMGGSSGRLLQTHTQSGGRLRSRTAERGADGTPDRGAVRMLRFGSDQPPHCKWTTCVTHMLHGTFRM